MAANLCLFFFPTIVSGGGNFGVLRKPWKTDQAVSVYSWTEERQTSLCHHCRILYFSHTHLYLPIVIVFIRLSDLPDSSLALWRKQLFQIVLCVMSKNVFCKCTKIFFYPLCVFRGVAVLIWCSWRSTQCSTVKTVNFLFTSRLYRWHVLN